MTIETWLTVITALIAIIGSICIPLLIVGVRMIIRVSKHMGAMTAHAKACEAHRAGCSRDRKTIRADVHRLSVDVATLKVGGAHA